MTELLSNHLLSVILWLPLVGALAIALIPKRLEQQAKVAGLFVALATFVLSLGILQRFDDAEAGFQLVERSAWLPAWGVSYALGIDGISLWLTLLTTFLTPLVLLSAWNSVHKHVNSYIVAMLALEFGMIGSFLATDLLLFYVFFELMLVPMYLIIGVWGGPRRIYAAIKFFLFTIAGSLLMLVAILYLVFVIKGGSGAPTFNIVDLYGLAIPMKTQALLFFAFTLAFAIKVPLFPFHTWLPDAHVEAPTGGSIILAGVLLKLGTYGFLRFVLPFFPEATYKYAPVLAVLSVIGIIYGALVAWVQPDMKKLVAYSSVSHLGFCVLGIFAVTQTSIEGSILQMVSHGLSTGALFLLVGVIYDRRHTRMLADFGGLAKSMPVYATIFVIVALSSAGLPGLNGFVGEFLILTGSFKTLPWYAVVAASGVILAALYLLWLVQRVFFGPLDKDENKGLPDMQWNELAAVVPLLVFIVWIGVYPNTFLKKMEPSVRQLLTTVEDHHAAIGKLAVTEPDAPAANPVDGVSR
ncbi:MAG: NADH-quinone oxidoreductase subunit M [Acidobacteria bacterium]|nr:NADH-quinone oxidoreductase subunit M [Acidobacteriota bacterium]